MWQAMAAGAALGLAKNALVDKPKEERQRALAAQTALYSPWTGMKPNEVQESDMFGNAMQGATSGAMLSQGQQQADMQQQMLDMKKKQMEMMQSQAMGVNPNLYSGQAPAGAQMSYNSSPYSMMS
jgi:uncharacterized protein YfiM (DUF2279 family)